MPAWAAYVCGLTVLPFAGRTVSATWAAPIRLPAGADVRRYFGRKLLIYALTFVLAVTIDWMIPRFMPGNPVDIMLSRLGARGPGAVELMRSSGAEGYAAESYLDLCLGYLDLDDLENARRFGELGLETATEVRQVRNAHYLLGEVALKAADVERAEFHFEHLAKHYPDFANLKNLLYALDLRKMVNFKL